MKQSGQETGSNSKGDKTLEKLTDTSLWRFRMTLALAPSILPSTWTTCSWELGTLHRRWMQSTVSNSSCNPVAFRFVHFSFHSNFETRHVSTRGRFIVIINMTPDKLWIFSHCKNKDMQEEPHYCISKGCFDKAFDARMDQKIEVLHDSTYEWFLCPSLTLVSIFKVKRNNRGEHVWSFALLLSDARSLSRNLDEQDWNIPGAGFLRK